MARTAQTQQDPADLLQAEQAVARVLAECHTPARAYPRLLDAIGSTLGWEVAAAWEVDGDALRCVATWARDGIDATEFLELTAELELARNEGLPGRVWATGRPMGTADVQRDHRLPRREVAERVGLESGFCFPVRGAGGVTGAVEVFCRERRQVGGAALATSANLGRHLGQFLDRWRAEQALRQSEARKTAILDAAFDCVITMDHEGRIVEVNRATERTFGYRAPVMAGRDLADLIIPPELREAHRRGLRRYLESGEQRILGHPFELPALHRDGHTFPVEIAITQPRVKGPPLFTGYLRDVTARRRDEEALRTLAAEQAALRRVAELVATEPEPRAVFSAVSEEVGRLLGAHSSNMVVYDEDDRATVVGAWSSGKVKAFPVGADIVLDGDTATMRVRRTGRPARIDDFGPVGGELAERLRGMGFRSAVAAPIMLTGRLWGAVIVSSEEPHAFAKGAEERIGKFAELVGQALANAEAREQLAASRARIVRAADAERRRLERNLHDGAQQRLLALALTIRLAERQVGDNPDGARALLGQAADELETALAELRELARGLHPAVLSEHGLAVALDGLAARAPVPVDVELGLEGRLPEPVEAAAYYLVAEALANVAKYAGATVVRVRIERSEGELVVTVADDGIGGADERGGSGLRGLADRVEALSGRLEIRSPAGAGTTLCARVPLNGDRPSP